MKRRDVLKVSLAVVVCCLDSAGLAGPKVEGKKILKLFGWDKPMTAYLRDHVEQMEKTGFDGISIIVMPDKPVPDRLWGNDANYLWFSRQALRREDFRKAVADLRATKFRRFTDNFVHYPMRGPDGVDWFEPQWKNVLQNARVGAWICKQGGLKGVLVDVEDAGQLRYRPGRAEHHSFQEYARRARRCGREWMQALTGVKPDIVVILSHGYWVAGQYMRSEGVSLQETPYALLPAFLDGVLEGCGNEGRVVDGGENTYPFVCYKTFADFRRLTEADNLRLTAVPDRYRQHYSRAFGVWPGFPHDYAGDAPLGDPKCRNPGTPETFEHAVYNALAAADEYAWVWSGLNCWWPPSAPSYRNREFHVVPRSYVQALARAREPHDLDWAPLPPDRKKYPSAKRQPGYDDDSTFGPLWKDYEPIVALPGTWWFRTSPDHGAADLGVIDQFAGWAGYQAAGLDGKTGGWREIRIGEYWENQGFPYNGVAWYRGHFTVPQHAAGRRLWLSFGGVAGRARIWAAGPGLGRAQQVGRHSGEGRFEVPVTGAVVAGKDNVVIVRVINRSGPGGIYKPVKLIAKRGEQPIRQPPHTILLDLSFDENKGDTARDDSPFHHHAAVHGAEWVAGVRGSALQFDGRDDYVDCGNAMGLNPMHRAVTWELWFNPIEQVKDGIVYHALVCKHRDYTNGLYVNYQTSPNRIVFIQATPLQMLSFAIPKYGCFYHIVGTHDGKTMRLYVNGKLLGSRRASVPPPINNDPVRIGGGAAVAGRFSKGIIDHVRMYNWALSDEEVRDRYRAGRE